ncbi:unnamed protein product, partial [Ectocarpus sp. 8 AP-2014]
MLVALFGAQFQIATTFWCLRKLAVCTLAMLAGCSSCARYWSQPPVELEPTGYGVEPKCLQVRPAVGDVGCLTLAFQIHPCTHRLCRLVYTTARPSLPHPLPIAAWVARSPARLRAQLTALLPASRRTSTELADRHVACGGDRDSL